MASANLGLEVIVNFLAPASPDRYFQTDGKKFPAALDGGRAGERIARSGRVAARGHRSLCNGGAELLDCADCNGFGIGGRLRANLPGSQVLAVTPVELAGEGEFRGRLTLHVKEL